MPLHRNLRYASAQIVVQMVVIVAQSTSDECCNQCRRCEAIVDEECHHQEGRVQFIYQIQNTRRTSAALSRSASANSKQTASVSYSFLTLPFWFKTLSFAETPFCSSYRPTKTVMPGRCYPISRKTPCLSAWFKVLESR